MLGSVSYDSADFVHTSENLSFSTVGQIPKVWLARIDKINADRTAKGDLPIDVNKLLNHPVELANTIWGSDENDYGNIPGSNDGWDFRPRGMYQLVGREQYVRERAPLQKYGEIPSLDITVFPDALWNAKISAKVTFAHFQTSKYSGHTLFELLQDKSLNWAAVRGFQSDMDHAASDQAFVEERSEISRVSYSPEAILIIRDRLRGNPRDNGAASEPFWLASLMERWQDGLAAVLHRGAPPPKSGGSGNA